MAKRSELDYAKNFVADAAPTLASVLAIVEAHSDISKARRADMRSAFNAVNKAHGGIGLAAITAEPARLRRTLNEVAPAALGVSQKRWANVRSTLRQALKTAKITRDQFTIRLEGDWASLWGRVLASGDLGLKSGLSRFPRYCQKRGISPREVTSNTLREYEEALCVSDISGNPHAKAASAAQAWNRACERIPDWPQTRVTIENQSNTYALSWSSFPLSLEADVDAWLAETSAEDLFADNAPLRPVADITKRGQKGTLLRMASSAVHAGIDIHSLKHLADLVAIDVVKRALRWVHEHRLDGNVTGTLGNAASVLRNAAKWYVKVTPEHLEVLNRVVRQASPKDTGTITRKNREALEPFKDERTLVKLLQLPRNLMHEAGRARSPRVAATIHETALAVALLTFCPVRASNLLSIELDRHIIRHGKGYKSRTVLHFPADEVKNDQDLAFELPNALVQIIDTFISEHRHELSQHAGKFLFAGRSRAGTVDVSTMSRRITRALQRHVGVRLTFHQFRHLAVLIFGTFHKNDFEAMRLLMGHKSTSTVMKYYAMIETDAVHRAYAAVLKSILDGNHG